MRLISSPARTISRSAKRGATVYLVGCLMAASLFTTGCHKAAHTTTTATPPPDAPVAALTQDTNQATQATTATSDTIQNPNPATPMVNPNLAPLAKANGEPDLTALDTALAGWVMANRRLPKSFAEFAATSGQAIPRPPPGKKYVITPNMHFQLVNQ